MNRYAEWLAVVADCILEAGVLPENKNDHQDWLAEVDTWKNKTGTWQEGGKYKT